MEEYVIVQGIRKRPSFVWLLLAALFMATLLFALDPSYNGNFFSDFFPCVLLALVFLAVYLGGLSVRKRRPAVTVTNLRIFGKVGGTAMDIPLEKVTMTAVGRKNSVIVFTTAGSVAFLKVENCKEVAGKLTGLLTERSEAAAAQPVTNVYIDDSADQLRKFKELLDDGVITQEEFEEKKRQILKT